MKMYKLMLPVIGVLALAGCATPYSCEMGMDCMNVADAYDAARADGGNKESVIPDDVRETQEGRSLLQSALGHKATKSVGKAGDADWNPYAGGTLTDKPVYVPPHPLRIWIAPWVDGNSRLLSGQFMYVTVGGGWTMGQMNKAGKAGEMVLHPYVPVPKNADRVSPEQQLVGPANNSSGGGSYSASRETFGQ